MFTHKPTKQNGKKREKFQHHNPKSPQKKTPQFNFRHLFIPFQTPMVREVGSFQSYHVGPIEPRASVLFGTVIAKGFPHSWTLERLLKGQMSSLWLVFETQFFRQALGVTKQTAGLSKVKTVIWSPEHFLKATNIDLLLCKRFPTMPEPPKEDVQSVAKGPVWIHCVNAGMIKMFAEITDLCNHVDLSTSQRWPLKKSLLCPKWMPWSQTSNATLAKAWIHYIWSWDGEV